MQSNGARIAVLAVAIGVVVALFVVLSGGDDDEGGDTTAASETTQTQEPSPKPKEDREKKERPKPEPKPEIATIEFAGGAPVGGVQELEFQAGERILFRVSSDQEAEFHLHGYDVEQTAPANGQTTFDLPADIEGVFELEDHATGAPVAEISVTP